MATKVDGFPHDDIGADWEQCGLGEVWEFWAGKDFSASPNAGYENAKRWAVTHGLICEGTTKGARLWVRFTRPMCGASNG